MKAYAANLKDVAKENADFRRVLFTGTHAQVVVMAIAGHDQIGEEVHSVDQILYAVAGEGEAIIDGTAQPFQKGDVVAVPAGIRHNIRNTEHKTIKLFTIYAPPEHVPGTVHHTKAEALRGEALVAG